MFSPSFFDLPIYRSFFLSFAECTVRTDWPVPRSLPRPMLVRRAFRVTARAFYKAVHNERRASERPGGHERAREPRRGWRFTPSSSFCLRFNRRLPRTTAPQSLYHRTRVSSLSRGEKRRCASDTADGVVRLTVSSRESRSPLTDGTDRRPDTDEVSPCSRSCRLLVSNDHRRYRISTLVEYSRRACVAIFRATTYGRARSHRASTPLVIVRSAVVWH